ncbi:hypothetical protein P3342_007196 [Pyrenophora teres f. teres]|nr:hypothetical protein P3342_007196 [Pyrenophora teres f. teres]
MSHDNSASPSSPQTACLETNALDCYFMGNTPEQDAVMFLENETATAHFSIDTIGTFPSEHSATNLEPRAFKKNYWLKRQPKCAHTKRWHWIDQQEPDRTAL